MKILIHKNKDLEEWHNIVDPILNHPEFLKRKDYMHHGKTSVYDHSVKVSIKSYFLAKKLGLDYKSAAIAGLLHDFYTSPWQNNYIKQPLFKRHGFTHAKDALSNSKIYFNEYMNPVVENSIVRHMFPLNIIPPKYKEGYIITIVDKCVSMDMILSLNSMLNTFGIVKRS